MPIQQKPSPQVLLFSDFAGWAKTDTLHLEAMNKPVPAIVILLPVKTCSEKAAI